MDRHSEWKEAEVSERKRERRQHYRRILQEQIKNSAAAAEQNKCIIKLLKSVLPENGLIGAYQARPDEVSLADILNDKNYKWAFPRIDGDGLLYLMPKNKNAFAPNEYGINEPLFEQSDRVELADVSVLIVPAMAFDRKCMRLGRGKGYYDRVLENFNGLKIGVARMAQISNEDLPVEQHDVAMDMVVTDQFILRRFDS